MAYDHPSLDITTCGALAKAASSPSSSELIDRGGAAGQGVMVAPLALINGNRVAAGLPVVVAVDQAAVGCLRAPKGVLRSQRAAPSC